VILFATYALAEFAQRLGWPAERVVVIDEDQGQSGKTAKDQWQAL
jgi:hypothetical protein